ncbi:MAG: hypothetical protein LBU83_02185 [Bacteroidales bacterium]|jgi:hypothetical protein|nr:hypothetical protein [Bacteroidales bacterium]
MKKINLQNMFLVFFLLFLTGVSLSCKKNEEQKENKKESFTLSIVEETCGTVEINEEEYIKMCVLPSTAIIDSVITFTIENHTNGPIRFGTPFELNYFNGTHWMEIELNCYWPLPVIGIGPEETYSQCLQLSFIDNLQLGKYRIIKSVSSLSSSYDLYAEFILIKIK